MGGDGQAIEILVSKFNSGGWPSDVNYEKLMKQYHLASDDNYPGLVIVEIERHRSVFSTQYVRGLPMSAFETYFMRYAVDTSTSAVQEISERTGGVKIDLDSYVDEELGRDSFSPSIAFENGLYKARESVSNEEALVDNQDDLVGFLLTFVDSNYDYFSELLDMYDGLSDDGKNSTLSEYREILTAKLTGIAHDLWEGRDID